MIRMPNARKGAMIVSLAALACAGLAGCAEDIGPRHYSPYEAGVVSHVDRGVVVGFRPIEFGPGDTTGATVAGGVGGALIGNAVSGRRDRGAATVLGAIGGAIIGNAVADGQRRPGFAYTIRLDRGDRTIEIPQADPSPIPNGVRVNVVYEGGRARVVPADGYAPGPYGPPPPPPPPPHY